MKLIKVTQLEEFTGWDTGDISDVTLVFEFKHAWKDYFKKHSCSIALAPGTLYPAKDFCNRIGIPFRFFIRWSIQVLGQFPRPWELNQRWLQEEVEYIWQETKDTVIPELVQLSPNEEAQKILKAYCERTR